MTPQELSVLHPKLYHVTARDAAPNICKHGLLPTALVVDLWELDEVRKADILTTRRPKPEKFSHSKFGNVIINDNAPLSEGKLSSVLDDGLTPGAWLKMLNERVFFFPDWAPLQRLLDARLNKGVRKDILILDTLSLAKAYGSVMEIAPINTGNTTHLPARRGKATFAPLLETDYQTWRRRPGKKSLDRVKEVSIRGPVHPICEFVLEIRPA